MGDKVLGPRRCATVRTCIPGTPAAGKTPLLSCAKRRTGLDRHVPWEAQFQAELRGGTLLICYPYVGLMAASKTCQ